jgi:hypothetical protein
VWSDRVVVLQPGRKRDARISERREERLVEQLVAQAVPAGWPSEPSFPTLFYVRDAGGPRGALPDRGA